MKEDRRHLLALIGAWGGWWGAVALFFVIISMGGSKPVGNAPNWLGLLLLVCMGIAITAGNALGRMRLTAAILGAFTTGLSLRPPRAESIAGDVCIARCDLKGRVISIERGEVIGWPGDYGLELVGESFDQIIPEAFLDVNHAALKQYTEISSGSESDGVTVAFRLPVIGVDGREREVKLTIIRQGDVLIKTLVPIIK